MLKQTILSLDLGTRHVGTALAKSDGTVTALKDFQFKDIFELENKLNDLVTDYGVELLLAGDMGLEKLPPDLSKVLDKVAQKNNLELKIVPERYTSFQAESHSHAALNILRDYLGG